MLIQKLTHDIRHYQHVAGSMVTFHAPYKLDLCDFIVTKVLVTFLSPYKHDLYDKSFHSNKGLTFVGTQCMLAKHVFGTVFFRWDRFGTFI